MAAFKGLLTAFGVIDKIALPDTSKIYGEVYGIEAFRPWVLHCMNDLWPNRLKDLEVSVSSLLAYTEIKPFDSFDLALNSCVREEASRHGDHSFAPEDIKVWTAFGQDK